MTGNKKRGLVLQPRDRKLLEEISRMRIVDRELAKVVAGFGSTTRANTRLLRLTRAGLLRSFFFGTITGGRKAMYTLSIKGQQLVGSASGGLRRRASQTVVGDLFIEHQMKVNEVCIITKFRKLPDGIRVRQFRTFRAALAPGSAVVPDGYFEIETSGQVRAMFVEVDLGTEALRIWQKKISEYLKLATSGQFTSIFSQPQFRVLVITTSERRLKNIRATVARVTDKIFWFSTFSSINRDGFWSPIWLRPGAKDRQGKIPGFAQAALSAATVVCIGAGGLISHIAPTLVRKGVGRLKILDRDIVEASNLNRQRFYARDLGKNKAVALARNLKGECIAGTEIHGIAMRLEQAIEFGVDLSCDVAICGVDNNSTRSGI